MTLIVQGINSIRDAIYDKLKDGKLGTDGSSVSISDTSLGNEITGTTYTLTKTKGDMSLKLSYTGTAGDVDGYNVREFGFTDTNDDLVARSVFPELTGGSTTVVSVNTQLLLLQDY